jgi:hypothetical protein
MHSICWVSSYVDVLFKSDDVDILTVVNYLTGEGDILKREDSQVLLLNVISEDVTGLHIEASLTEYGTNISTMF